MKLMILEDQENKFYIDIIKGGNIDGLYEDIILPDDTIKQSDMYSDKVDTRKNISTYLEPLASKIRKLHYIETAYTHYPKENSNDGLSSYVRIIFKHPYGISDEEINDHYYYTIRFSDHKHEEAEEHYDAIESYEVVGEKPTDLSDIGWEIFEDYADEIKDEIRQHEIEVYGYPKTSF